MTAGPADVTARNDNGHSRGIPPLRLRSGQAPRTERARMGHPLPWRCMYGPVQMGFAPHRHPEAADSSAKRRTPNEGSVHWAGGTGAAGECIDASARKRRGPQDDSGTGPMAARPGLTVQVTPPSIDTSPRCASCRGPRSRNRGETWGTPRIVILTRRSSPRSGGLSTKDLCIGWRQRRCRGIHRSFGPQKARASG